MKQKTAVITGATTGIGLACAERFNRAGYKVFNLDIRHTAESDAVSTFIQCDVSQPLEIQQAIEQVIQQANKIDILVSNAGVHFSATIEQTSIEDFNRIWQLNFSGCFFTLQAVLPVMREQQNGSIVLMSSDQAFIGKKQSAVYGATKAAIAQLAKSTALDYAEYGIRVNAVCSGTIDTPLYRHAIEAHSEKSAIALADIEAAENNEQPVGRVGKPSEVAELVAFLADAEQGFMTGGLYPIDGGYTAQ